MILQYILFIFIIIFIIIWGTIKIKYPFWNNQPVFHTYDYLRSFYKQPFIVQLNGPFQTKYIDHNLVQTKCIDENQMPQIKEMAKLLQENYISGEHVDYMIQPNDIYTLHTGQNAASFLSIYVVPEYTINNNSKNTSTPEIIKTTNVLGCITSRSLQMFVRPTKTEQIYSQIPIYFIDYLCIHREQDYKKLSRTLLQTHEYNQRMYNKNIECSLIKKEGEQFAGIRPLISYTAYIYNIPKKKVIRLKPEYNVRLLTVSTMDKFIDFFTINTYNEQKTGMFDIMVLPDIGNLTVQVKEKQLYIGCLYHEQDMLGFYFFKDVKQYNDNFEAKTLSLISSVQNCMDGRLFYIGFIHVLRNIIHINADYKVLTIENISHNKTIINNFNQETTPSQSINMAYYSYNYVYPCSPIDVTRSFILL